jgi:DeoR family ulaG and ulaABCDEF operon transcriptional repressor
VRNGAEAVKQAKLAKSINNASEKQRIAEAASHLCQVGDSVLLTCGSTMLMLGEHLCGRNVQVITNYLPLAQHLIENHHEDLVIIGGQYNRNKQITLTLHQQSEPQYAANIMFTSGKGFTEEGLFKTDMIIANSEKQMAAQANKYIVLLDSTKLGQKVGMLFQTLSDIDMLITGKEADATIIQALRDNGLDVLLV